jgi:hypothetical protein
MLIAPCSIKRLSAIANSYDSDLLARAADVQLKEGRQVVLLVREAPLHTGHLRLMQLAAENGAIIFPPVPTFYNHPTQSTTSSTGLSGVRFFAWASTTACTINGRVWNDGKPGVSMVDGGVMGPPSSTSLTITASALSLTKLKPATQKSLYA